MKRIIAAAVLLLSAAGAASAADLPSLKDGIGSGVSPNTWTGFYAGVNGGYGWDNSLNFKDALPHMPDNLATKPAGWFGGVTLGADWYTNGIVIGLVTDFAVGNVANDSAVPAVRETETGAGAVHSTVDWFGTLRGRIGLPMGNQLMPYGTGGLAYGGVSNRGVYDVYNFSADETLFGWTAGAGVEWRLSPGWSLSGEWLHVDLGAAGLTCNSAGSACTIEASARPDNVFDVGRAVLVYRFDQNMRHPQ